MNKVTDAAEAAVKQIEELEEQVDFLRDELSDKEKMIDELEQEKDALLEALSEARGKAEEIESLTEDIRDRHDKYK